MNEDVIGMFVPILAILGGVCFAIIRVLAIHRQRLQRAEFRHKERLAAIDKGLEMPPDPPEQEPAAAVGNGARYLRQGLVLVLVGAVLTVSMTQLGGVPYLFGLVPAAVGAGYLLYYFIHRRHEAERAAGPTASGHGPGAA